jgi:hypothetical protein
MSSKEMKTSNLNSSKFQSQKNTIAPESGINSTKSIKNLIRIASSVSRKYDKNRSYII